jgi:hypothetical protein
LFVIHIIRPPHRALLPLQVLNTSSNPATRLEAMLVLGRLAARCVAVQQDAVREGAVPVLVGMMQQGKSGTELD